MLTRMSAQRPPPFLHAYLCGDPASGFPLHAQTQCTTGASLHLSPCVLFVLATLGPLQPCCSVRAVTSTQGQASNTAAL